MLETHIALEPSAMPAPPTVLVVYAHPAPQRSRVNRKLADAARAIPHVDVHDLYETYPDFYIDPALEQARLAAAGTVVFLHPIQWYSMPALLKEWVDVVFQPGWAFGPGGDALKGKAYWLVATTGGPADSYRAGASHGRPFDDYLPPYRQTAALCGMDWQAPLILHAAHLCDEDQLDAHVAAFAGRLRQFTLPSQG